MTEIDNRAEQRALEKAGFTREGVLRGYGFQGGRWHDAVLYGILRDDVDLTLSSGGAGPAPPTVRDGRRELPVRPAAAAA